MKGVGSSSVAVSTVQHLMLYCDIPNVQLTSATRTRSYLGVELSREWGRGRRGWSQSAQFCRRSDLAGAEVRR